MKLSAVMIVKNEEIVLENCLKSLQGFDEIVILDTGSTDHTGEIARKYTDKYFEGVYKWNDNFAEARNAALALATGDWCLTIDADETLESGSLEKIRSMIENDKVSKAFDVALVSVSKGTTHYQPALHRRMPDIFWKGTIHNYLSVSGDKVIEGVRINYGYSPAHSKDPNRALRILTQAVSHNPKAVREVFYLAREYVYRRQWDQAIKWYLEYLNRGKWPPEIAEARYQLARCYWSMGNGDKARQHCLQAIAINTDFKSAIEFMAYISGPNNKERWLLFSESAKDEGVLFSGVQKEKPVSYYDRIWLNFNDLGRYKEIWETVGDWVGEDMILDIGCGSGDLHQYVKNYYGFDFSGEAIKRANLPMVWEGNVGDIANYRGNPYVIYVALGVLERIEDEHRLVSNIPVGKRFIFSVPSFPNVDHLRFYTEKSVYRRLGGLVDVRQMVRFNWRDQHWVRKSKETNDYILLFDGIRRDFE